VTKHNDVLPGPECITADPNNGGRELAADPRKWAGRFPQFVREYGAERLRLELGVVLSSVYHWVEGSWSPHYRTAKRIVDIAAREGFELSISDVMDHHQNVLAAIARGNPTL
jgi:hypothetical protein